MKKIWQFLAISFGLASLLGLVVWLVGLENTPWSTLLLVLYMFTPFFAALIVQKVIHKEPLKPRIGFHFKLNWWWLAAIIVPIVMCLTTLGVGYMFPGIEWQESMSFLMDTIEKVAPDKLEESRAQLESLPIDYFWIALIQVPFAGATMNAVAAFGEEAGWRGFMHEELRHWGFWKSSLFTGLIWGFWHAPIIIQGYNYPEHPVIGVFMMAFMCMIFGPIMTFVRIKSKSVVAASVMHGTFNAGAGLAIMNLKGGSDLLVGMTGLAGILVMAAGLVPLFIIGKAKLDAMLLEPDDPKLAQASNAEEEV